MHVRWAAAKVDNALAYLEGCCFYSDWALKFYWHTVRLSDTTDSQNERPMAAILELPVTEKPRSISNGRSGSQDKKERASLVEPALIG